MEKQQSVKQLPSPNLSPQEWESLFDDFGSGSASRRSRWLHIPLVDLALYSLLRRDFPSHLKPLLLFFIDDFLSSPSDAPPPSQALPPLIDALRSLLSSVDPSAAALRDQFMVTTVSAAISTLDAPLDLDSSALLEPLVEILLTVANRPNHGHDRQSRATACECLRELETAFPCLLKDVAGHLWVLAQAERTHVAQSYLLLLAAVVRDLVLSPGLLSSPISILSTAVPLVPFNVPGFLFSDPAADRDCEPSEVNLREIKRVLAFLWERPQALTPSATMELVSILTSIASTLEQYVPTLGALLKVQFSGLIYSYHPILCHVVLMLYSGFPDAFSGEDERNIALRLALMAREAYQPLPFRLLALHWLLGSPRLGQRKDSIAPLAPRLYPAVFDALSLKAKKLDALARIAANLDDLEMRKKGEEEGRGALIIKFFQDGLVCVSAFQWLPPWSTETSVTFRMLHKFLIGVAPHRGDCSEECGYDYLVDSTIFSTLQSKLVSLAMEHRGLVPVVVAFVDRLVGCKAHQSIGECLLHKLDEHLLPKLVVDYQLTSYFPIFEKIAENNTIPPRGLLEVLTRHIATLMEKHGPDSALSLWSRGNKVLGICRIMLKHHHSSRVFLPLSRLLAFICQFFPDLEVRDNARIYLRMLVSIPGKKLRPMMHLGEQPSAVPASPHPGSFFHTSSSHSEDLKSPGGISSYIFLERAIPPLVKQSWSLVLLKPSVEDNAETNKTVGIDDISVLPSHQADMENEKNFETISTSKEPFRVMDSKVAEILGVLRKYFSCIPDYRHMPAFKVKIPCILRFDSEVFNRIWGDASSTFDSEDVDTLPAMYATTVTFSSSSYGSIPPCRIPFLLGEPLRNKLDIVPVSRNSEEQPIYHASIVVELEPREPTPGLIDVTVKANAENGQIISGRLQSIPVGIEDMFLKVIIPPDIEECEMPKYMYNLFHALWEACGNSENTGGEIFPLSGGKGAAAIHGTRSVKLLETHLDSLVMNIEQHLAPYVVGVVGNPLVNIVRGSGIIKDIICENDSECSVANDITALVPYSENVPLQLPYLEDEDIVEHHSSIKGNTYKADFNVPHAYMVLILVGLCVGKMDRIRNESIREKVGVASRAVNKLSRALECSSLFDKMLSSSQFKLGLSLVRAWFVYMLSSFQFKLV
ncbi:hypothetical protein ZIOFF_072752 [Zingiber officinale]|uniref:AP5B1 middle domain-containing protein n=1 Tax=Zingiber officinale TaxID=94328 RepID=A0A8J5ENW3_ZINOF|nr:hypothetical protein ZIOFF_072752 [Zingiber officinale]